MEKFVVDSIMVMDTHVLIVLFTSFYTSCLNFLILILSSSSYQ